MEEIKEVIKKMRAYHDETLFTIPANIHSNKTKDYPQREAISKLMFYHLYWKGQGLDANFSMAGTQIRMSNPNDKFKDLKSLGFWESQNLR